MRPSVLLLLLCVRALAGDPAAPLPDERLLHLEQALTGKLEERKSGRLPPDQYIQFATKFRVDLDKALAQSPDTSVNRGRHAIILARLDEAGPGQAVAGLDRALQDAPDSSPLLNAKGAILLQQGDYAGALASAEAVLKRNQERGEPPDPEAVAIRQFSKGRTTPVRGSPPFTGEMTTKDAFNPTRSEGRPPIQFTQKAGRTRVDVPLEAVAENTAEPSLFSRGKAAVIRGKNEIVRWTDEVVLVTGRNLGVSPDEEADMLRL